MVSYIQKTYYHIVLRTLSFIILSENDKTITKREILVFFYCHLVTGQIFRALSNISEKWPRTSVTKVSNHCPWVFDEVVIDLIEYILEHEEPVDKEHDHHNDSY